VLSLLHFIPGKKTFYCKENMNWKTFSIHICPAVYKCCRDSETQYEMVNEKKVINRMMVTIILHMFVCFWKQIESKFVSSLCMTCTAAEMWSWLLSPFHMKSEFQKQSSAKPTDGFGKHLITVFTSKLCFRTPNAPNPSYLFNAFIQGQNQN